MTDPIDPKNSGVSQGAAPDGGDFDLDSFFDAARAETPVPSGDFMARMEALALDAMPAPAPVEPGPGIVAQLFQLLGGWQGAAGLAAACAAGVWLGVSPPEGVTTLLGTEAAELSGPGLDPLSGFDLAMMEG